MAETEFIKANAAEKDDILVGAEIHDPAPVDAEQARRKQVLAAMTNVVQVAFFNYHNGAIKWIFGLRVLEAKFVVLLVSR